MHQMEDNELPTDGGKEDANKSKSNKNLNDVEINDSSWRLERKKLIISRKGSMGRFLGRIMHSKRFHADRLPTSSATVSSSGEQDPPKRPPRRKTLVNSIELIFLKINQHQFHIIFWNILKHLMNWN